MIQKLNSTHQVVIYSKSYCPYCRATKALFEKKEYSGVDVHSIELDHLPTGGEIQRELLRQTGQMTVPSVFVNGQHAGGNSETQSAASSGKLSQLLSEKK